MVDHANRAGQRSGRPVRFSLARAQDLPFDDDTFDGVTCTLAMHHVALADRPAAVAEMFRVLRSGGRLVIADAQRPTRRPTLWVRLVFSHAISERPLDQAADLMRDAGFTDLTHFDTSVPFIGLAVGTKPPSSDNVGSNGLS
jgi:demethylmenaquinone methyltransferase/2-methoxy-6-polyprenyl-1,4-benzoquinol methylase